MLRVTQSDLPAVVWLSISRHPRMSLETSSSDAMAIGRGGKFNRISLLSYFLLLCVLLLSLLSRSRGPTMGFHSPIQRLLRRSISAQRKSDLRAHFSSLGRRLGTRSDVVTTRGWKVWMSRREVIEPEDTFRSTNQRSIQLLTDQSTAN